MAEPEGGESAGTYDGTPAHSMSIPMVSGGHGSIHDPEIKPEIARIPIDAEKEPERSHEPIFSPDLLAKAEAADARLLGSRRTSRTPSIERSAEPEERPKTGAAFAKAIHRSRRKWRARRPWCAPWLWRRTMCSSTPRPTARMLKRCAMSYSATRPRRRRRRRRRSHPWLRPAPFACAQPAASA